MMLQDHPMIGLFDVIGARTPAQLVELKQLVRVALGELGLQFRLRRFLFLFRCTILAGLAGAAVLAIGCC